MERESFENHEIAALMNEHFVNIKVDREERPDLDQIYMKAVQALTGHGGWPMTVFLTPDGEPFYGGTYFPPEDRARHARLPARAAQPSPTPSATRRDEVRRSSADAAAPSTCAERGRCRRPPARARRRTCSTGPSQALAAQLRRARTAASAARPSSRSR